MYSAFDHWAYWSHMLTVISMFSPCTQWVFGPLSPVSLGIFESHVDCDLNVFTMYPVGIWALVPSARNCRNRATCGNARHDRVGNARRLRERGMREVRDSARHAEIVKGRSGPVSDLCWRYLGVVKADENEAGHRDLSFSSEPLSPFHRLASHLLSICANSATCEQLFSVFGNTLTKL